MIRSIDQMGRTVLLEKFPVRIISLVPSISELLWDLEIQDELVGITKFCIHPTEMFRNKTRIGGTKNLEHSVIASLQPDLIIGNKEENTKADIQLLSENYPVWMSDVNTVDEALQMISEIGRITNHGSLSTELIKNIEKKRILKKTKKKVIYLIWNEPCFAVGKYTFIDTMLEEAGFENCVTEIRYPEINTQEIKKLNPDFLFLSTEPFPFQEKHFGLFENSIPRNKIVLVDGESFSWYGSRMIKAYDYFQSLQETLNDR